MATPPTYPATDHLAEGTGVRSHNAVSTTAGDYLVVEIEIEAGNANTFQPAASGLSFTKQNDTGSNAGDSQVVHWTAPDALGGSRTVQITPGGGSSLGYTSHLTVVRGSTGPGAKNVTAAAQSVSLARQGDNSGLIISVCDFNVGNPASVTWLPAGAATQTTQQGTGATYCHGRLDDSGAQGTANCGVSSVVFSGASTAALEMLGTTAVTGANTVTEQVPPWPLLLQLIARAQETYSANAATATDWTQDATDETGLTDNQGIAYEQGKGLTDDAGLTDAALIEPIKLVTATDSAGLTDAAILDRFTVATDSAGLTDTNALDRLTVATDNAGLTDAATVQAARTIDQTDSAGLTDASVLDRTLVATDTAGLTDTRNLDRLNVATDSAGLTDASVITSGRAVDVTDTAGLADAATFSRTLAPTDTAGLTDTAALARTLVASDTAGLTDAPTLFKFRDVTATDTAGLADGVLVEAIEGGPPPAVGVEAATTAAGILGDTPSATVGHSGALRASQSDGRGAVVGQAGGGASVAGATE